MQEAGEDPPGPRPGGRRQLPLSAAPTPHGRQAALPEGPGHGGPRFPPSAARPRRLYSVRRGPRCSARLSPQGTAMAAEGVAAVRRRGPASETNLSPAGRPRARLSQGPAQLQLGAFGSWRRSVKAPLKLRTNMYHAA